MSNRFHNKFHRENHHSKRTASNNSIVDASYDPIASYSAPFQGEFYSEGEIVTNSYMQAASATITDNAVVGNELYVGSTATLAGDVAVGGSVDITNNLDVTNNVTIGNTLRVTGDGYISGDLTTTGNLTSNNATINNNLTVFGDGRVAGDFIINGSLSATGNAVIGILNTGTTDSVVTEASGTLQKRDINSQVWVVTDTFVTCNTPLSVGYIQKANTPSTLDKSVIYENISNNIGIGTITPNAKLDVEGDIRQYSLAGNNQMTLSAADPAGTLSYTRYYNSVGYSDMGQSSLGTYIDTSGQNFSLFSGASRRLFIDSLNYAELSGNLTITGNLSVFGDATMIETTMTVTSAFSITNAGSQPALIVEQTGNQDVALFKDDGNTVLSVKDGGKVGVNTSFPNHALTVVGSISSTDNLFANTLSLSSVTITGEITTSTTAVTATDSYLKVQINGTTKYLRLFDVV